MFGNHKRKLQDDEESLVPHGLVWHATAEPTPEEVAKSEEALGYTVNYAQEIERARREQTKDSSEQGPAAVSQVPPAGPAVIPWWRMEQPEPAVKRPPSKPAPMPLSAYIPTPIEPTIESRRASRIESTQVRPTPAQPVEVQSISAAPFTVQPFQTLPTAAPNESPSQTFQPSTARVKGSMALAAQVNTLPTTPKPQVEDRLIPRSSEITDALALAFSRIRAAGKAAWLSVASLSSKAAQRGQQTLQSFELHEALNRAGHQGQNLMRGGIAKSSQYARTTGSAVGAFSRAGISRVQQISARVRTASATSSGDVVRPANSQPSTPSRVRLALTASALQARIIAARQLSSWRLRRERMAIDSRFWASMTMAAIAAIIALVIVSVVPHYAAKSLPSRMLNTNPSVNANVVAPIAAAPAQKSVAPIRKTTTANGTQASPAKTNLAKANSAKASASPKPKHVVQDDYVAPNTYKYYGTGSKASR